MTRMPSSSIHLLVDRPSRNHDSNNLHPPSCNSQIGDETFPGISWVGAAMVNRRPQCNWVKGCPRGWKESISGYIFTMLHWK